MYRPWTQRTIGIEMEMNSQTTAHASMSERDFRRVMQPATARLNTQSAGYYHSGGSTWDIKYDGSCGYEVASPALTLNADGENEELRAVCAALGTLSPQIDRQCGLHVHVACNDFDWQDMRRLLALWARYEPFFFMLCPPSRRRNTYCGAIRKTEWAGAESRNWTIAKPAIDASDRATFERNARGLPRYTSLNISGWWTHGRVEFRLHSGTIQYEKIRNWAKLLLALVERAKNAPDATTGQRRFPQVSRVTAQNQNQPFNTYYICKVLGLINSRWAPEVPESNAALVSWAEARRRQFNPNEPTTLRARARHGVDAARAAAVAASTRAEANDA